MNWSLVLNGLGTVANLIATGLAAYSIRITIKEYKFIHKNEQQQIVSSQGMLWYNEIVLQDIIKEMNSFIEHSNKRIADILHDKPIDEEKVQLLYSEISDEFQIINVRLLGVKIFDYQLYKNCDAALQNILDIYADIVEMITKKQYFFQTKLSQIQENKIKLMKILYNYGKEIANS